VSQVEWTVEHLDAVDSTNTWLANRAREGATGPWCTYADYQSAGRGRRGREWVGPPRSSLLCSVLLDVPAALEGPQWLVSLAALAMAETLAQVCGVRPTLKWPNDLMFDDRKVAGILAEVVAHQVVIGLGLNLDSVDPALARATSVRAATGVTLTPDAVLTPYLDAVARRYDALGSATGRAALRSDFIAHLDTLGRRVRVERTHDVVVGRATGVDELGSLQIDTGGDITVVTAGDVVHLRGEEEQ